jgi:hypothetical protein
MYIDMNELKKESLANETLFSLEAGPCFSSKK